MSNDASPRISPGGRSEIGWLNAAIVAVIRRAVGTRTAPHIFTTLARNRRLFRAWLVFAGALMPRGSLPRADTELVILRVAHLSGCDYEWRHHEQLGRAAGLSEAQIDNLRHGPDAEGWSARQLLLLRAVEELHERRQISDELWLALRSEFAEPALIELLMLTGHYEMLATTIASLRIRPDEPPRRLAPSEGGGGLAGRRILITGAARGIGAALARRLHERGARLVLAGIEPDVLAEVAAECGESLAVKCDVRDREQVEAAVEAAVEHLGGLDVVVANAGVAAQLPILGGNPEVFERTMEVNLLGVYYTLRAAAPHIAHERGYALAISSLAAAIHLPLMGAYCAAKAGVEALADSMRIELASSGARVGVAYFAELETEMTERGFGTDAARRMRSSWGSFMRVAPLRVGIDAIERGIARRSRRVVAPGWVAGLLPVRMIAQRVIDLASRQGLDEALEIARRENAALTTELPPHERATRREEIGATTD